MTEPWLRRVARRTLILGVRGRGARGSEWGEAVIGEFEETTGSWDAVRWTLSGLRATRRATHVPEWVRIRRRAVVAVVALAVIGVPVNAYAAGVALNPSGAMAPALQPGDRILVDKLSFRWTGLDHGDIVVITVEDDTWIKRVIGLPGDVVECRAGAVFRNGSKIDEDYLHVRGLRGDRSRADPHVARLADGLSTVEGSIRGRRGTCSAPVSPCPGRQP
ncbi:signal peptidase I [Catellatospora chokoriensis]|uniref:Signal peptidase I n=1 Tax=Catellatospora chokoriensis TaxID=310353 RepID=A0A8J3K255_9ACTN|nr:signal peptidase I [Catellatospora chokoriensis]GIF91561.1 hypothetical protein Cch02nite_50050 [Catellatospora chokoriensis]